MHIQIQVVSSRMQKKCEYCLNKPKERRIFIGTLGYDSVVFCDIDCFCNYLSERTEVP